MPIKKECLHFLKTPNSDGNPFICIEKLYRKRLLLLFVTILIAFLPPLFPPFYRLSRIYPLQNHTKCRKLISNVLYSHLTSTTMAHYLMMNPRKESKFVTEQRCACPTSRLYAIKFNEVKCKLMSPSNKICTLFCYVLFFFIVSFGSVVMVGARRDNGSTAYIIGAPISCFVAIFMTIICAALSEFTHTALEVLYKCRSCGRQVHVTYEVLPNACSWDGGEIFNAYGRYTRTCQNPVPLSLKTTAFDDIERAYRNMRPQYDQCCRTSVNWTRQMINRLR